MSLNFEKIIIILINYTRLNIYYKLFLFSEKNVYINLNK